MAFVQSDEANRLYQKYRQDEEQSQKALNDYNNYGEFQFDAGSDPEALAYSQRYTDNANKAMKDTMGNSASLTGGYANSWGQQVAQQTYQNYMDELATKIQGVRSQRYGEWQNGKNDLLAAYNLYNQQAQQSLANYNNQYNTEYNQWWNAEQLAEQQRQFNAKLNSPSDTKMTDNSYKRAVNTVKGMISGGNTGVEIYDYLDSLGIDNMDAKAILADSGVDNPSQFLQLGGGGYYGKAPSYSVSQRHENTRASLKVNPNSKNLVDTNSTTDYYKKQQEKKKK